MQKLFFGIMLIVLLLVEEFCLDMAPAAERERLIRIGGLTASSGPTPAIGGVRDGLLELGYREDEDFVYIVQFTRGNIGSLPSAARLLVADGVELIITDADEPTRAAQQATTEIPIVFAGVADPAGLGPIKSFAQPGGNVTGVTTLELHLGPKRLQVFHEVVPGLKRVLFTYDADEAYSVRMAGVYREATRRLGIELIEKPVRSQAEALTTLAEVRKGDVDGILMPWSNALNIGNLIMIVEARQRIPAMYSGLFFPEHGGFISYGPNSYETGKQAARLVDKILKGANPAEIPVEVNSKIEFAINLKRAKALGLTIPPTIIYQATRVIR